MNQLLECVTHELDKWLSEFLTLDQIKDIVINPGHIYRHIPRNTLYHLYHNNTTYMTQMCKVIVKENQILYDNLLEDETGIVIDRMSAHLKATAIAAIVVKKVCSQILDEFEALELSEEEIDVFRMGVFHQ